MYVGLKQPRGDGERCVTPARAAAKETSTNIVKNNIISMCIIAGIKNSKYVQHCRS